MFDSTTQFILRVVVYLACFGASMYGLSCIQFEKVLKGNKVKEFYVLYYLLAMALGYLAAQFLMGLMYRSITFWG
ncbi:MAG: DUF1146 domain-containing protein [Erysipelotrichaceae bacterium]|nr:DUF1146 domain-containing protein [Erysipelotrichaceae bacterium]